MSLRDTFIRVNRHRAMDSKTGFLSAVGLVVLDQVWAVAADEGERDGADVLVDRRYLRAGELLMELPRHPDFTLDTVASALEELIGGGLLVDATVDATGDGQIRIPNLAAYNRDRFRKREWKREQDRKRKRTADSGPSAKSVDATVASRATPRTGGAGAGAGVKNTSYSCVDTSTPSVDKSLKGPPLKPKPKAPRKPSGDVQTISTWFRERYREVIGSPCVLGTKDYAQLARVLKQGFGPEEIQRRLDRGLVAADDFLEKTDRGLALLLGQINSPALRGASGGPSASKAAEDAWTAIIAWRTAHCVPGIPSKVPLAEAIGDRALAALLEVSGNSPTQFISGLNEFAEREHRKRFIDTFNATGRH